MLVLSRKINQSIMIGDGVEICIVDIKGDQVKIGIDAPKHVSVYRKEVYTEIKAQNIAAAAAGKFDPTQLQSLGGHRMSRLELDNVNDEGDR